MTEKLKHGLTKIAVRLVRPYLVRWVDTRVLYVSKTKREELAKRFGVPPELVDAVYQSVRSKALTELHKVLEEKR